MTADELRDTLRALDKSQTQFAQEMGVEHNTVWRWVHGVITVPQYAIAYLETLRKLQDMRARLRATLIESGE